MGEKDLAAIENNLCAALLEAASYRAGEDKRRKVVIKRNEKILFEFTIEPLSEEEWQKIRRQNLNNRGRANESLNSSRFFAQAIFKATIDEDKERLWKNSAAMEQLNVASPIDLVNAVLTPAEKTRIVEVLSDISGYGEDSLDDMIKNS